MSLSSSTAGQLLASARNGGGEALGRLFRLYENYLKLLAASQLHQRLRARVSPSDVVQETFCEAHRDFHQFRGQSEGEFLGWLRQILVHNLGRLVERHLQADKRDVRREVSLDEIRNALDRSNAGLEAMLADDAASPSSNVQRNEQTLLLADKLAALSPDYRDVIVMRHLQGLSFNEIGERLGRTSGAVRMVWLRAIEQLRRALDVSLPTVATT